MKVSPGQYAFTAARSMNITFACPECRKTVRVELGPEQGSFHCPECQREIVPPLDARSRDEVRRCLVCPSVDLYARKDFPQHAGVLIVLLGFAASCVAWYFYYTTLTFAILFTVALIDLALYTLVGDSLMCYRCGAEYRGVAGLEKHGPFALETHEKHRQQQARLAQQAAAEAHAGGGAPLGRS